MNVRALEVARGEPIQPAWMRLKAWVKSLPDVPVTSGKTRVHRTPTQTTVVAETQSAAFQGRFAVRISGMEATVGEGELQGITPTIKRVPISGVEANGKTVDKPRLKIVGGPNAGLRSWIALQVTANDAGDVDTKDPEAVSIIHTNDLKAAREGGKGIHALAMLVWSDKTSIKRVRQIVYMDQQHAYRPKTAERPAKHLFWPAS